MSQLLPYNDNNFDRIVKLEDIINTLDDNDIGCFVEVELKYPNYIFKKSIFFPFATENEDSLQNTFWGLYE